MGTLEHLIYVHRFLCFVLMRTALTNCIACTCTENSLCTWCCKHGWTFVASVRGLGLIGLGLIVKFQLLRLGLGLVKLQLVRFVVRTGDERS